MTYRLQSSSVYALLLATFAIAACDNSTGPKSGTPVALRATSQSRSVAQAAAGLDVTSLRLVIDGASLGSGDQFGCMDCQGGGSETSETSSPKVVSVPLNGGTVSLATEQVGKGHYTAVEISIAKPDAAVLAANPGWAAGTTIEIKGAYNGVAFTLPLSLTGGFRETVSPALDVTGSSSPAALAVTITLPVQSWFTSAGRALNPNNAADRVLIEANIQKSLLAPETEVTAKSEG